MEHTLTFPALRADTGDFSKGQVAQLTLTPPPGTYRFICTVSGHEEAGMFGTLVVQ
jgi:uncharacterized cupredoxin-like copper-binding protein